MEKAPLLGERAAAFEFPPSSVFAFAVLVFTYCYFAWAHAASGRDIAAAAGLAGLSVVKRQLLSAAVVLVEGRTRGAEPLSQQSGRLSGGRVRFADPEAGRTPRLPWERSAGAFANRAADVALWTAALRGGLATGAIVAAALTPVICTLCAAVASRRLSAWQSSLFVIFPEVRLSSKDSFHAQIAELIGYLLSLTLWSSVLCPHFVAEEYAVLLHVICLPAAVGATASGMVHAVGRTVVNVQGLEELTRKTVEGCAAMFFITGAACAVAVTMQRSVLTTFEYSAWLQISGIVTLVATVVELLSSWDSLICTVSCSASLVLFAWTY